MLYTRPKKYTRSMKFSRLFIFNEFYPLGLCLSNCPVRGRGGQSDGRTWRCLPPSKAILSGRPSLCCRGASCRGPHTRIPAVALVPQMSCRSSSLCSPLLLLGFAFSFVSRRNSIEVHSEQAPASVETDQHFLPTQTCNEWRERCSWKLKCISLHKIALSPVSGWQHLGWTFIF